MNLANLLEPVLKVFIEHDYSTDYGYEAQLVVTDVSDRTKPVNYYHDVSSDIALNDAIDNLALILKKLREEKRNRQGS